MLDAEQLMKEIAVISRKIKANALPAWTPHQKQAAVAMATLEKTILSLLEASIPHKIIFMSLFYFWLTLEAPMRGVSEDQLKRYPIFPEAVIAMIEVIKAKMNTLPDYDPTIEMKALGDKVDALKSFIPDECIEQALPKDELVYCSTQANTLIHTVTSYLLMQSFHPEIISNVIFGYWLRLSTVQKSVDEKYYQKIEYYFNEIHQTVRDYIPVLFKA